MQSGNKTKARALLNKGLILFLREVGHVTLKPRMLGSGRGAANPRLEPSSLTLLPVRGIVSCSTKQRKGTRSAEAYESSSKAVGTPFLQATANSPKKDFKKIATIVPENILSTLVENVRPCIEIRKVRVARATYQVPAQISKSKGQTLALRWIVEFAKKRKSSDKISFAEALAQELRLAHKKQGQVRDRRSQLHRLAEANRSYMRYRWW